MLKKIIYKKILIALIFFVIVCSVRYTYAFNGDFNLYVTSDANNNNIQLEWNISNGNDKNYIFRILQSKDDENDFNPISTTNFVASKSSKVSVLNIYPGSGENVEFTYKDGTKQTLPKSAMLKVWMEGGTIKYESGKVETYDNYGRNPETNEQIIFVDLVSMDEFNNNPSIINKYDVCLFGTWDYNGNKDLTQESKVVVEEYIKSGKGVLCGHDTIGDVLENFWSLREYFKIDQYSEWELGSRLKIVKKGLLTNFPWKIGDIGDELSL